MILRLRIDNITDAYIIFSLYSDDVYAGELKMRIDAYNLFVYRLRRGTAPPNRLIIENNTCSPLPV